MLTRLIRFYWQELLNWQTLTLLISILLISALLFLSLSAPEDTESGPPALFEPVSLSIVDLDQSVISYTLIDQFRSLEAVDTLFTESMDEAAARLERGEILLILYIPDQFYEATRQRLSASGLTIYLNESMPSEAAILTRMLNNAAESVVGIQSAIYTYQAGAEPLYDDPAELWQQIEAVAVTLAFRLVGRKSVISTLDSQRLRTVPQVISSLATLLAMLCSLLLLPQIRQEKESGLHVRLTLAGIRPWQSALARQSMLMLLTAALLLPFLLILSNMMALKPWPLTGLILLLAGTATAALMIGLASLSPPGDGTLLAAWLLLIFLLLAGGCIYPESLLPGWLNIAGHLSPAYWSRQLIYNQLTGTASPPMAWLWLGGLLLFYEAAAVWGLSQIRPDRA